MIIKKFKSYCESISGTELIGHMGPNYGEPTFPRTITDSDTHVVFSELDNKFYTQDEYDDLYQEYLKVGGSPLSGFNKNNLDLIIGYLKNAI